MKKLILLTISVFVLAACNQTPKQEDVVLKDELTVFDDKWNVFRSQTKQYSLQVPKETKISGCDGKEEMVAVTVLTGEEFDFVTPVEYFDLTTCEKVKTTLENADEYRSDSWKIIVSDAETDADLDKFIKEQFGQACAFESKEPSGKGSDYDVQIKTTGPDVSEDQMCFINWITTVKFDPTFKKVAKFDLGQDAKFYDLDDNPLDPEMQESFLFEDNL